MSTDERQVIEVSCKKQIRATLATIDQREKKVLASLRNDGVNIREFPADVLSALRGASSEYLNEKADQNALYKETLQSYRRFMNRLFFSICLQKRIIEAPVELLK